MPLVKKMNVNENPLLYLVHTNMCYFLYWSHILYKPIYTIFIPCTLVYSKLLQSLIPKIFYVWLYINIISIFWETLTFVNNQTGNYISSSEESSNTVSSFLFAEIWKKHKQTLNGISNWFVKGRRNNDEWEKIKT